MKAENANSHLAAEAKARVGIDRQLAAAGWIVEDRRDLNLYAGPGVAAREFTMAEGHGRADYLLFVERQAVGTIEAKPEGTTLTEVEIQSSKYATGVPGQVKSGFDRLPSAYESTDKETRFTNGLDPNARSRRVFTFHRPETMAAWIEEHDADPDRPTLRHRLRHMPPLEATGLWQPQFEAIKNLEASLANDRPRALIQMATGSGKIFTAASVKYRLIKHAQATPRPVPRRPVEPRTPDPEGVPAVHHAR